MNRLYTNTGKVGSIVGLIFLTAATSYVSQNSTKIIEGSFNFLRRNFHRVARRVDAAVNKKTKYECVWRDGEGNVVRTGLFVWK